MSGIDWSTQPAVKGINLKKQRALLTGFLLVSTNSVFSNPDIPLVNQVVDGKVVPVKPAPGEGYIDMSNIYPKLAPLSTDDVNGLFDLARNNSATFSGIAQAYWNKGHATAELDYVSGDYCLSAGDVLALNK
jgi:hypothetical protein